MLGPINTIAITLFTFGSSIDSLRSSNINILHRRFQSHYKSPTNNMLTWAVEDVDVGECGKVGEYEYEDERSNNGE